VSSEERKKWYGGRNLGSKDNMLVNNLLFVSLAPVLIIALYVYSRDKYEKEPLAILLRALMAGVAIVLPVVLVERFLSSAASETEGLAYVAYTAFIVAGLTEEAFKYIVFLLFFWNNRNFNEKFDGIVYAVYIALGFAAIENLLYVFTGGVGVGMIRAITAVPAHALFGIVMGFYLSKARFSENYRSLFLFLAFFMPFVFHGIYDFLLMSQSPVMLVIFVPLFIYFWVSGFRKMAISSDESSFRDSNNYQNKDGYSG